MRKIIKLSTFVFSILVFISCEKKVDKVSVEAKNNEKYELSADADLKKVSLNIEGMTCEIGCARMIQSKLSKTEGVKFAKVNFEKKNGIVEYDANKVSEKQIVSAVEQIAGGDLYKVIEISSEE